MKMKQNLEEISGDDYVLVFSSVPDTGVGRGISKHVVEERLAACVSMVTGVESHYVWDGKYEVGQELILMMKTTGTMVKALKERVLELHPYDCPEFLVVDVVDGSEGYLEWVSRQVSG